MVTEIPPTAPQLGLEGSLGIELKNGFSFALGGVLVGRYASR